MRINPKKDKQARRKRPVESKTPPVWHRGIKRPVMCPECKKNYLKATEKERKDLKVFPKAQASSRCVIHCKKVGVR